MMWIFILYFLFSDDKNKLKLIFTVTPIFFWTSHRKTRTAKVQTFIMWGDNENHHIIPPHKK